MSSTKPLTGLTEHQEISTAPLDQAAGATPTGHSTTDANAITDRGRKWAGKASNLLAPAVCMVIALAGWQTIVSVFKLPTYLVPSPADVVMSMEKVVPKLIEPTLVTASEAYLGFGVAAVVGFLVALIMARWDIAEKGLYPYMVLLQTVPIIAVAPVLVVWLGPGLATNMVVAAMIAVFPVAANTLTGLKSTDRNLVQLYRMAGASRSYEMFSLRIPYALPYAFTGLRIAAGSSVIGAIVGEFVAGVGGGRGGLGYVITSDAVQLLMPDLFCAVLAASAVSLFLFGAIALAERILLQRWHESAMTRDE